MSTPDDKRLRVLYRLPPKIGAPGTLLGVSDPPFGGWRIPRGPSLDSVAQG